MHLHLFTSLHWALRNIHDATAKHQQQTIDINYGLFSSFGNISDNFREEYDLKKHQGQHIWKGNKLLPIVHKNKPRILTFSRRRQNRLNVVLNETRTARTRVWDWCAHASLSKFTFGSGRSLSRPRILRSLLIAGILAGMAPSCSKSYRLPLPSYLHTNT